MADFRHDRRRGGPGGCAVATRLGQSLSSATVALIEAGPAKASLLSDVPPGIAALFRFAPARNYAYEPIPANRGLAMQCLEISGSQFAEGANGAPTAGHSPKTFTNASGRGSWFESSMVHHALPSAGVTRFHRYYGHDEPPRHPTAPEPSLAGARLIIPDHAMGLPVFRTLSLCTCRRQYPGAAAGRRL